MEEKEIKTSNGKKKIIMISSSTTNTGQIILFALCEDGSVHYIKPLIDENNWTAVKKL